MGTVPELPGDIHLVVGPSGVGKNTLIKAAMRDLPGFVLAVSYTTRPPRPTEKPGESYHFVDRQTFTRMIAKDGFLEHAEYSGHFYGTLREPIEKHLSLGKCVFVEIETKGAQQIMRKVGTVVSSYFIMPPEPRIESLRKRLIERQKKTGETINIDRRLKIAENEMALAGVFDHLIVNEDKERATREFISLVSKNASDRRRRWHKVLSTRTAA